MGLTMSHEPRRQRNFHEPYFKNETLNKLDLDSFRRPLLVKEDEDKEPFCGPGGLCCCIMFSNVLWGVMFGTLLLFSAPLLDMRDSNAATTWIIRQLGQEDQLKNHSLDDPFWLGYEPSPIVGPPPSPPNTNNNAALNWILRQLGEGENLETHPVDDPWWLNRTLGPLNLPFGPIRPISPALEWILLKLGQEESLRNYNVSDPWWTHRPQTNITLNATNVTVAPLQSLFSNSASSSASKRRLSSDDEQPTRLFVDGKVRVSEYVEYFSVPKEGFVKLIVAPESLRFVLKVLGMTERPWYDDEYWLVRNNASEVNITNTLNLNNINVVNINVGTLTGEDVVVDSTLNTFGTVDFWPEKPTESRRLARSPNMLLADHFSKRKLADRFTAKSCRRCAEYVGEHCSAQCVPHMHILGGVLKFNNHSCTCVA